MKISGRVVDIENKKMFSANVVVEDGFIVSIDETRGEEKGPFILPGFIDAHVHIESSMLIPSEFARLAVVHGTLATVSDPHEIANVLGIEGVNFMIENGKSVPFKFFFGAPSCVPATIFETAGAKVTVEDIEKLFENKDIKYLAEMMNWPGVLSGDKDVFKKIEIARHQGRVVDGHAPGLRGYQAHQYASAGITTDHECFTKEEAIDKLAAGMKILIREGSAAKNFDDLVELLHDYPGKIMFCSDDKHPDSLLESHINDHVRRAVKIGVNIYAVLEAACITPVKHYNLDVGTLKIGDSADFILVDNLQDFNVLETYISGTLVAKNKTSLIASCSVEAINKFDTREKDPSDFKAPFAGEKIRVIEALDGQLITNQLERKLNVREGSYVANIEDDILKITVVNRYRNEKPAVAYIKNFGLKSGAMASSVAHDSHNIIAVGIDDASIARAVNLVIQNKGGLAAIDDTTEKVLPLPVAGLMSTGDGYDVAQQYIELDKMTKKMGSTLKSPFMTLSFMALLVIPSIKLSDKGLFDGQSFQFISLQT